MKTFMILWGFFFNLHFNECCFFLGLEELVCFSSVQDVSLVVSFPSSSSSFCFLSSLNLVALSFFFAPAFFGLQITTPSPFLTVSNYWTSLICIPSSVPCFSTDFLLFCIPVAGLSQRLCFVLCRGLLCLPTDFRLFRTLVPGLLQRLCLFCAAVCFVFLLTSVCSTQ